MPVIEGYSLLLSQKAMRPRQRSVLPVSPPVYDTQYWAEWSQPYGLLRTAAVLKRRGYKKLWLYDFLETGEDRQVDHHRIAFQESHAELDRPEGSPTPCVIEKGRQRQEVLWRHFGKSWEEFDEWIKRRGLQRSQLNYERGADGRFCLLGHQLMTLRTGRTAELG